MKRVTIDYGINTPPAALGSRKGAYIYPYIIKVIRLFFKAGFDSFGIGFVTGLFEQGKHIAFVVLGDRGA